MKTSNALTGALIACATIVISGTANANVVDFSGGSVNMGNLQIGQTGTITDIFDQQSVSKFTNLIIGALPKMSAITFSYTLPSMYQEGALKAKIAYNYNNSGVNYQGSSVALSQTDIFNTTTSSVTQQGYINGNPSVSLVTAAADLATPGDGSAFGKVAFNNYTGSFEDFSIKYLQASMCKLPAGVITYYVSNVPLPSSLPMIVLAISGLFAFANMHRQRKPIALNS